MINMTQTPEETRPTKDRLRVLLADESAAMCDRLREQLTQLPFIEIVGHAGATDQTLALFFQSRPDVVIASILLPEKGGFEVLRCIKRADADCAVVLTSHYTNPFVVQTASFLGANAVCSLGNGLVELRSTLAALSKRKTIRT
jgi:DNA-binding NarL/FixJ family response regulator